MANIEIAAMTGRQVVLNSDVIEQFHKGLRGGHLLRDDDGYAAAKRAKTGIFDARHRRLLLQRQREGRLRVLLRRQANRLK